MAEIGMNKTVRQGYDEVLAERPELLQAEGFGVLSRVVAGLT
jgi:hypothetical protein